MKKALITGASKRIGKQIAYTLAKEGYNLVLHYYKSKQSALELKDELLQKHSNISVELVCANLEDTNTLENIYSQIESNSLPNILINNASVFEYDDLFTFNEENFNKHMSINVKSPILLSKKFACSLSKKNGNIVNILDQTVEDPSPYFLSYTLSKMALHGFTKIAAMSLAPNVRVNSVSPGLTIKSSFQSDEDFKKMYQKSLLKKPSSAEDIANAVLFILKTDSITGQNIVVDSGHSINKFPSFLNKHLNS